MDLKSISVSDTGVPVNGNETESPEDPVYGEDSPVLYRELPRREPAERWVHCKSVSILPPKEVQGGRNLFRIRLELDTEAQPSSLHRRTGTVSDLVLDVEEKELTTFGRLSGRRIRLTYLLWTKDVLADSLQRENSELREEIQHLRRKLRTTQDQLQFHVETQIRESRS